jgi:2-methylisocitrate lyase-like PEP mutase family enzyme
MTISKVARLRSLHVPGTPLVLPNAWDAASARLVEAAGFPAVATSSNAMAAVLGTEDGERLPVGDVLSYVAAIAASVDVPVTADVERGYGLSPEELVERIAATGPVGVNLEDSDPATGAMVDAAAQADLLAAVRAAATALGTDLVINARTDSFLRRNGAPEDQLAATLERGARYLAAGADCVYPIAAGGADVIRALVEGIPGPVNVGHGPGGPSFAQYAALGVARVSFGPTLQRHLYNTAGAAMLAALAVGEDPMAR